MNGIVAVVGSDTKHAQNRATECSTKIGLVYHVRHHTDSGHIQTVKQSSGQRLRDDLRSFGMSYGEAMVLLCGVSELMQQFPPTKLYHATSGYSIRGAESKFWSG